MIKRTIFVLLTLFFTACFTQSALADEYTKLLLHCDGPGFEDMERRCPNIEKIKKLIGFEPSYNLEAIVKSVIEYFKE